MPWQHCGLQVGDDQPCPTCGVTKAQWTVQWEVTRTFKLKARAMVRLQLVAADGVTPMAGARWSLRQEDGAVLAGALDDHGQASVPAAGGALRFPDHDDEVAPLIEDDEGAAAPPERAEGGGFRVTAGRRARFRLAGRWLGVCRRLDTDEEVEFRAHLPLRVRGPQLVVDPLDLSGDRDEVPVRGRVVSPGRLLDPGSVVRAWIDGVEVAVAADGAFEGTARLRRGHDEVSLRATDATGVTGRARVETWRPSIPEGAEGAGGGEGAGAGDDAPRPASAREGPAWSRPPRAGRARAEAQRFLLAPAVEAPAVDLVVRGADGAELARAALALEPDGARSRTAWVVITAAGPDAAPAVEATAVLRVPDVRCTLTLEVAGAAHGEPLRLGGWDGAPAAIVDLDASSSVPLGATVGGAFGEGVTLRWLACADADGVLLPGDRGREASASLARSLGGKAAELAGREPVDLTGHDAPVPPGWSGLELEARETVDPWEHRESFDVLAVRSTPAGAADTHQDQVLSAHPARPQRHDDGEAVACADRLLVRLREGTTSEAAAALAARHRARVLGYLRRDRVVVLHAGEPLDQGELRAWAEAVAREPEVEHAGPEPLVRPRTVEPVRALRAPDLLRAAAARPTPPVEPASDRRRFAAAPGGLPAMYALALRHLMALRALPAQQLMDGLRGSGSAPHEVNIGIADTGLPGSPSPDLPVSGAGTAFPWGARLAVASGTTATVGERLAPDAEALHDVADGAGHGALSIHAVGGSGTTAYARERSAAPAIDAPCALELHAAADDRDAPPWSAGTCPFARLLPVKLDDSGGAVPVSAVVAALRLFAEHDEVDVVNLSWGSGANTDEARDQWRAQLLPSIQELTRRGKVLVASGGERALGERSLPTGGSALDFFTPTGARTAADPALCLVTASEVDLFDFPPVAAGRADDERGRQNRAQRALLDWGADHRYALRADPRESSVPWTFQGPHVSVAAPGQYLALRTRHGGLDFFRGTGTSFAAPLVAGLVGMLYAAARALGRPRPAAGDEAALYAHRMIEVVEHTADRRLFTTDEAAAGRSDVVGHGRADGWAALLTVVNGGPMSGGRAPHAHLTNLGEPVAHHDEARYGFDLTAPVHRARPVLVDVESGAMATLGDPHAVPPVCDATSEREVACHLLRGEGGLPLRAPGAGAPRWSVQLTLEAATLGRYSHLCFVRPDDQPAVVARASGDALVPDAPPPGRVFWGLPLDLVRRHDVATLASDHQARLEHWIVEADAAAGAQRLRVTFDRLRLAAPTTGEHRLAATICGRAVGGAPASITLAEGERDVPLAAPAWSVVVNGLPWTRALDLRLEVTPPGGAAAAASASWPAPAVPLQTDVTAWGFGQRRLTAAGGAFTVDVRIEQEPRLPRTWRARLAQVTSTDAGERSFSLRAGPVRSAWSASTPLRARAVARPAGVEVDAPWVPGQALVVAVASRDAAGHVEEGSVTLPVVVARGATTTVEVTLGAITARVDVTSVVEAAPAAATTS